ncbi:exodeoxyribonuclease V subunit gamma, partial [Buchnera aphidicola]|nr:exodeoxyribonuclease V subunit gamma [Buchnera aphidicola]
QTTHKKIDLKIQKYHLHGVLLEIQKDGLLRWKPNKIIYSDRISLWLEHLIYCALGGKGESKIIGLKKKIWCFHPINQDQAYQYLSDYIKGYIHGIQKPLFLTKSGFSWLDKVYDVQKKS